MAAHSAVPEGTGVGVADEADTPADKLADDTTWEETERLVQAGLTRRTVFRNVEDLIDQAQRREGSGDDEDAEEKQLTFLMREPGKDYVALLRRSAPLLRAWLRPRHLLVITLDDDAVGRLFQVSACFPLLKSVIWRSFTAHDPLCLCDALAQPQCLQHLVLDFMHLPAWRLARLLALLLPRALRLRVLWLLAIADEDWRALLPVLTVAPSLTHIALTGDPLNWATFRSGRLSALLSGLLGLQLNLGPATGDTLAALGACTRLRSLTLLGAAVTVPAADALAQALSCMRLLRALRLTMCFTPMAECVLASVLAASGFARLADLRSLDLSSNHIDDHLLRRLAAVLAGFPALQRLILDFNSYGNDGISALAAALPRLPALTELSIDPMFDVDGEVAVMRAYACLPQLRCCVFPVTSAGDAAFLQHAVPQLRHLVRLHVTVTPQTPDGAQILVQHLPLLHLLQDLRLTLSVADPRAIMVAALTNKPKLRSLTLRLVGLAETVHAGDAVLAAILQQVCPGSLPELATLCLERFASSSFALGQVMRRLEQCNPHVELTVSSGVLAIILPAVVQTTALRCVFRINYRPALTSRSPRLTLLQRPPSRVAIASCIVPSLLELAARILLAQPTSDTHATLPEELRTPALLRRLTRCVQCDAYSAAARCVAFAVCVRERTGLPYLVEAGMCMLCYQRWLTVHDRA